MTLTKDDITELQQHIDGVLVKSYFVIDVSKVADELEPICETLGLACYCMGDGEYLCKSCRAKQQLEELQQTLRAKEEKK